MSKYDRDIQDVYAVKQLGDAIGYGHLMAIAHELWARHLESKGLPRRGAHCVVGYLMVKEQFQAEALNDKIYTIIVGKALEADLKTEPTISKMEQVDVRSKDEPQTEEHCENCRHKDECEGATYEYKNTEWWCLAYAPIDEPQSNADQRIQDVESVGEDRKTEQTEREGE